MRSAFFILLSLFAFNQLNASQIMPVQAFSDLPDTELAKLSPSGNKLAILKRVTQKDQRKLVIEVTDYAEATRKYPVVIDEKQYSVNDLIWASERHILIKINFFKRTFIENFGRNPKRSENRLMVLDIENKTLKNIISGKTYNRFQKLGWEPQHQDTIVSLLPDEPDYILHALDWDVRVAPQVFKVNLNTLERKTVQMGIRYHEWIADQQGNIRVSIEREVDSGGLTNTSITYIVRIKKQANGKWEDFHTFERGDDDSIFPIGFDPDPNLMLASEKVDGHYQLVKINLSNGVKTVLQPHQHYSINDEIFYSPKSGEAVGTAYLKGNKFWDNKFKSFMNGVNKALPNTNNKLISLSKDETKYLIYASSDTDSGSYYLGDRTKRSLNPIAYAYQNLDPALMRQSEQVEIKARDGRTLSAYLTRATMGKNSPTILVSDHGESVQSHGGFNLMTQFFANQGYNVLRVNFRNGAGAYYNFIEHGVENWAPTLYEDLEDAHDWLLESNISSSDSVCLYGDGFAAYIAMLAVSKQSGKYQCVAAKGGLYSIPMHLSNFRYYTHIESLKLYFSDNSSIQKAYSPTYLADQIDVPVLLIHSEDNDRMRAGQSRDMHKALLRKDKESKYLELEGLGQDIANDSARKQMFSELLTFFDAHLK